MADVRAFRAYRYDLSRVGALSDVVALPYDVIDPALQDSLYARSPYNVVRLILNKEMAADDAVDNRYTRAQRTLAEWLQQGVLVRDSAPAVYVCHQQFDMEGRRHVRRGFLARMRLEALGRGLVFPHEETRPGPKADRLRLLRATRMNLSPVFGIYPDDHREVQAVLDSATLGSAAVEASDHLSVTSRLWPVTSDEVVDAVRKLMAPRPIFIADGHHRYETSLAYLAERQNAGDMLEEDAPDRFVLMMFIPMSDPGLVILPTHRLVSGIGRVRASEVGARIATACQVQPVGTGPEAASEAWRTVATERSQAVLAMGTADGVWQLVRFANDAAAMKALAPQHGAAWLGLAVSRLHVYLLAHLLEAPDAQCEYVHRLEDVIGRMQTGEYDVAALVPPTPMTLVAQIAKGGERMPVKSTYFYPKLLSGLVFNPLTDR
jgi:uncharacterized protein (DUF1015 family)